MHSLFPTHFLISATRVIFFGVSCCIVPTHLVHDDISLWQSGCYANVSTDPDAGNSPFQGPFLENTSRVCRWSGTCPNSEVVQIEVPKCSFYRADSASHGCHTACPSRFRGYPNRISEMFPRLSLCGGLWFPHSLPVAADASD